MFFKYFIRMLSFPKTLRKSSLVYCQQQRWALITVHGLKPCPPVIRMFLNVNLNDSNVNPQLKTCHIMSPLWECVQEESVPCSGWCALSSETLLISKMCCLLLVTVLSPLECLQSGTGRLSLSGMMPGAALHQLQMGSARKVLLSVSAFT